MVLPLNPFQLIPAQRCRGVQFFWQLQLFGRVLPAPPIAGCQPWRGEAERWASPINEVDKLTTNLRKEWQENHRETQEQVIHSGPSCPWVWSEAFSGHWKTMCVWQWFSSSMNIVSKWSSPPPCRVSGSVNQSLSGFWHPIGILTEHQGTEYT